MEKLRKEVINEKMNRYRQRWWEKVQVPRGESDLWHDEITQTHESSDLSGLGKLTEKHLIQHQRTLTQQGWANERGFACMRPFAGNSSIEMTHISQGIRCWYKLAVYLLKTSGVAAQTETLGLFLWPGFIRQTQELHSFTLGIFYKYI